MSHLFAQELFEACGDSLKYVVTNAGRISDKAARQFTLGFYNALAQRLAIPDAYWHGVAAIYASFSQPIRKIAVEDDFAKVRQCILLETAPPDSASPSPRAAAIARTTWARGGATRCGTVYALCDCAACR